MTAKVIRSVALTDEVDERLREIAAQEDRSVSSVIRTAVNNLILARDATLSLRARDYLTSREERRKEVKGGNGGQ